MRTKPIFEAKKRGMALSGFTLIELLVVISIMAIMATLVVRSIAGISDAGRINRAINGVSLALDQAHAYAVGHNTYTWVGFYSDPATLKLTVAVVAGITGVQGDLAAPGTFSPLTKTQSYPGFILPTTSNLSSINAPADDISKSSLSFNLTPPGAGAAITFKDVVQFSPEGEASIYQSNHWIQIVLQPVRGNNAANLDPNMAVIQVARATGKMEVYRP